MVSFNHLSFYIDDSIISHAVAQESVFVFIGRTVCQNTSFHRSCTPSYERHVREHDQLSDHCRLETLNEARQGQVNRVKIAEKEREGLEGEKLAAEAYLHKDAERLGTQSKIFQRFMHDGQVSWAVY